MGLIAERDGFEKARGEPGAYEYWSLGKAKEWYEKLRDEDAVADDVVVCIAGNKCDCTAEERAVPLELGEMFAKNNGLLHYETSAKTGQGVFRHKTRKEPFRTSLNAIIVLHIGLVSALVLPDFRASVVTVLRDASSALFG